MSHVFSRAALIVCGAVLLLASGLRAQDSVAPLSDDGRVVQFARDIAPILRERCLECHGPEDAKNDFRVDDQESLMDYIEAGDWESSTMYVDYLTIDDPDMLMPPASHGGPLSAAELALIRVWINEGAIWPEGDTVTEVPIPTVAEILVPAKTLPQRVWAFQGFFHPATVHFPVALFTVGALFVVLGWKWPAVGTQVPLACLILGAVSAIAASAMGWAFATERGYPGWSKVDFDNEFFWHRWGGVIVSVVAAVFALIAIRAVRSNSDKLNRVWKIGLLVVAGMVGAVGHQGGELSFGADFYPRAFRILMGTEEEHEAAVQAAAEQASLEQAADADEAKVAE
tara:strand:- start:16228 stop:17250 length:1023 start_codon:yes stop_codon:yes gene_type:complete